MPYSYDPIFAVDPANSANIAKNASITIFDPADQSQAPIAIQDPTGSPLPNPITVDAAGMAGAFQHPTLARVGWKGAGFVGYFTSYEGMYSETVAAKEAAQAAESAASTAGSNAAAVASAALAGAVSDAEAAATAAADAAALVGAPADTAIAAAITGNGAAKAALNSAYAAKDNSPNYLKRHASDDNLRPLRGALARVRGNRGDFRISAMGDSITFGQNVAATQTNHWCMWAAKTLAERLGVPFGRSHIWLDYRMGNFVEPGVTIGAGWNGIGIYTSYAVGMKYAPVGTATSIDIAFNETVDGANVLWLTGGNNTGNLIYSWNGGAKTTFTNPGGSQGNLTRTYIAAPSRGTHTLNLWQGATGFPTYITSVEPQDSTTSKVRWTASGNSGHTSTQLWNQPSLGFNQTVTASPAGFLNAANMDLFIAAIGDNDQMQVAGAVTTTTFTNNLENIRAKIATNTYPTSMLYFGPPPSKNEATWTPRMDDFMTAAEAWGRTTGVPVVRLDKRWKSWDTVSAAPYAFFTSPALGGPDSVHPGTNGTPDMGVAISRALANEI